MAFMRYKWNLKKIHSDWIWGGDTCQQPQDGGGWGRKMVWPTWPSGFQDIQSYMTRPSRKDNTGEGGGSKVYLSQGGSYAGPPWFLQWAHKGPLFGRDVPGHSRNETGQTYISVLGLKGRSRLKVKGWKPAESLQQSQAPASTGARLVEGLPLTSQD